MQEQKTYTHRHTPVYAYKPTHVKTGRPVRWWQTCWWIAELMCYNNHCQHGGKCLEDYRHHSYKCSCSHGFAGRHCEHREWSLRFFMPHIILHSGTDVDINNLQRKLYCYNCRTRSISVSLVWLIDWLSKV